MLEVRGLRFDLAYPEVSLRFAMRCKSAVCTQRFLFVKTQYIKIVRSILYLKI
jgi:tRNA U54 and U55 pseudouridine synthase Pus10